MTSKNLIPPDAIILSDQRASLYAWELISGWNEGKDTWALRYGSGLLAGLCSAGGTIINSHFRTRIKLGGIGVISSLLPTVLLPGLFAMVFHRMFVATDILLEKKKTCLMCYEVRSIALQLTFSCAYPMVMSPLTCFMIANRYNVMRLPSVVEQPKELLKFLFKISKSQTGLLSGLALVNTAAVSAITYYELKNHLTVKHKLKAIEEKIDRQINTMN